MPAVLLISLAGNGNGVSGPAAVTIDRFPCVVGRHSACDRRLDDPEISRRHCAFSLHDGRVWVEDLQSLNGTRLNGEAVAESRALADGDRLDLAHLAFQVRLPDTVESESVDLGGAAQEADGSTRKRLS
jgi:pSer/pThr/pTyr-binding forkhead associated (FHA) protein